MHATRTVTAFVVDDEPLARQRLRELIEAADWLEFVGEAATGRAAVGAIDEAQPDLLFLDVRLPDVSGIDVLSRIAHRPAVIFTTAYDQFAVTAFELGAVDYLLKPFGRERFSKAVERARPQLEREAGRGVADRAAEVLEKDTPRRLYVRDGSRIVPIPVSAVERVEACDDFVLIHSGRRAFRMNLPLADLEDRLDRRTFARVHRSHLVNLDHVTSMTPYDGTRLEITLRSGATLVASRQRSRTLRDLGR
ncbi:MAG: response regulator transcription factor [Acidobacteria bacterium]|nr:response regulator transcription factor [Acidobacteriota bacterium]